MKSGRTGRLGRATRALLATAVMLVMRERGVLADIVWVAPTGSGSWGDMANWSGGNPNGAGVQVTISPTQGGTISLDGNRVIGVMSLGIYNDNRATAVFRVIQGTGGSLIVNGSLGIYDAAGGWLHMGYGFQIIDAPVVLQSNGLIPSGIGALTINGDISGPGSLYVHGPRVVLAGTNSYANTIIYKGYTLTVGNGGTGGSLGTGSIINDGGLAYNLSVPTTLATPITGTGGFTQMGSAPVTLTGLHTYTGPTAVAASSAMVIDYEINSTNVISPSTALTIHPQASLTFLGAAGIPNAQEFTNTLLMHSNSTLNVTNRAGGSFNIQFAKATFGLMTTINLTGGSGGTVSLGTQTYNGSTKITASPGWTLDLGTSFSRAARGGSVDLPEAADIRSTVPNAYETILGPWATVNERTWATSDGVSITGLASYIDDAWTGGDTTVTTSSSVTSGIANSMRFNLSGGATVTLAGDNVIKSGGILVTPDVGPHLSTLSGGTLRPGLGSEFIINQLNAAGTLILGSALRDSSAPTHFTKMGPGAVLISGVNSLPSQPGYSGATTILAGKLLLGHSLALPQTSVSIAEDAALDLNGYSATLQSVNGAGTLGNSSAAPVTVTLTGGSTLSRLYETAGQISVVIKEGSGRFQDFVSYSGTTTLDRSTLNITVGSGSSIPSQSQFLLKGSTLALHTGVANVSGHLNGVEIVSGANVIHQSNSNFFNPTIDFGTIARVPGATLGFTNNLLAGAALTAFKSSNINEASGILGGWWTWSGENNIGWATQSGGHIIQLPAAGYSVNSFGPGLNTEVTSSFAAAAASTGSIRFATGTPTTLTLSGPSVVESGGILVSSTVFHNTAKITGGSLTSGNGADLIFHVHDTNSSFPGLLVETSLIDNGTTSIALTKAGGGTLVLSAPNSFSGPVFLNAGWVALDHADALPALGLIHFNGGGLKHSSANTQDLSAQFSQEPGQLYAINTGGQAMEIGTPLASPGGSFTKAGAGTLTFLAPNTYDGTTSVTGGVLRYLFDETFAGGGISVGGASAVLDLNGNRDTVGVVTLNGGTITGGTLTSTKSFEMMLGFSDASFAGEGIALNKTGFGLVILAGTNTYSGGTNLMAGPLQFATPDSLPSGTISFQGGFLQYSPTNPGNLMSRFSQAPGQAYAFDTNGLFITFDQPLTSVGGSLAKGGSGTLALGVVNSYTGATNVGNGTLRFDVDNAIAGPLVLSGPNAIADLNGHGLTVSALTLDGGTLTGGTVTATQAVLLSIGVIDAYLGGTNVPMTKTTSGTVTLAAGSSRVGDTHINGGALLLAHGDALGAGGSIAFGGGGLIYSSGNSADYSARFSQTPGQSFIIDTGGQQVDFAAAPISAGGSLTKSGAGTLVLSGSAQSALVRSTINQGTVILAEPSRMTLGSLTIASGAVVDVRSPLVSVDAFTGGGALVLSGTLTAGSSASSCFAGALSGTGTLIKTGSGTLTIAGNNSLVGTIVLRGGAVALTAAGSLTLSSSTIEPAGGSIVYGNSSRATLGGLQGSANLAVNVTVLTVGANNGSTTYSGVLNGNTLIKTGTGVWMLTGANNFSGTTTVQSGTLQIGSGGTTGFLASPQLVNDSHVIFERADAVPWNTRISGGGTLTQAGVGTLILTNTSTFSGKTLLQKGTLQLGNGTTNGTLGTSAITNGAVLDIKPRNGLSLPNPISGEGVLTHTGTGTTTLTGLYTATGPVAVSAGKLIFAARTGGAPPMVVNVPSLSVASNATLDLNNNVLVLQSDPLMPGDKAAKLALLRTLLATGFNNGNWLGKGITSSTVAADQGAAGSKLTGLVVYDNAMLSLSTFAGQSVDTSSLLVTTALIGDGNFDGVVDALDFSVVASHWQTPQGSASAGDLNFDGFVDLLDAVIVATHQTPPGGSSLSQLPAAVPEPATLMMLSPILLMGRRRRR